MQFDPVVARVQPEGMGPLLKFKRLGAAFQDQRVPGPLIFRTREHAKLVLKFKPFPVVDPHPD